MYNGTLDRETRRQAARAVVIEREPVGSVARRLGISVQSVRGVSRYMERESARRAARLRRDGEEALRDADLMDEIAAVLVEREKTGVPPPPPPAPSERSGKRYAELLAILEDLNSTARDEDRDLDAYLASMSQNP